MMRKFVPAEGDMFLSRIELLNRAYRLRGEEINYVEPTEITSDMREESD